MKNINWNLLKSKRLKKTRGVSFEEIVKADLVTILKHPVNGTQKILVYDYKGYIWAVPCLIEDNKVFLKTLYPSRKLTKIHKKEV